MSDGKSRTFLKIRITPRSARDEVVGLMEDGTIKIRLTAPPVDGKANKSLIQFLTLKLHISPSNIEIVSGHTSRLKLVSIMGVSQNEIESILATN